MYSNAVISPDGLYRYQLERCWDHEKPVLGWVMLNPSKADATANDPTVCECMRHARRWDYGGIIICNLFAFRATHPKDMIDAAEPVGPENYEYLQRLLEKCNIVVLAWGAKGGHKQRDEWFLSKFAEFKAKFKCLGKTHKGQPVHPLGTIGAVRLQEYP